MSGKGNALRPANHKPAASRDSEAPLRFILLFVLYLLAGDFGLKIPLVDEYFIVPWTQSNALAAAGLMRLVGIEAEARGLLLSCDHTTLSVKTGCNGVEAFIILASAILAFPGRWAHRCLGLLLGAIVIFGINLLRLMNLLLVAVHFPSRLELFHGYIWQPLIVLIAFGLFLLWG